ncbi:uncharacterized protein LOC111060756 isoform X2 [Nilaparvata lugens]|uniref:uncharacterized protein LOC111060756 isoform X2 n=1 Tax=Nilaparvata lugens TaxID=108931 RepID=UPI000B98A06C|nr:uncharacterized protein LOC111060756 isoform X2 [Nilaparvata lugens]
MFNFLKSFKLEGSILPNNWKRIKDRFRRKKRDDRPDEDSECHSEEVRPSTSREKDEKNTGVEETELKGLVDSIILAFINNIKKFLQEHEPVTIPQLPTTTIEDDNVSVKLTLKNLEIYKTSSFKVNKIQNSIFHMTEAFNMTFPEMEYHAQYELSGTVLGRNVKGKGKVRVYMTNLVTWGKAYATLKRGKVQLKKLNIDYTLEKITAKATGLKVSGKSDAEVEELLNSQLLAYFTKNERVVCDTISNLVVEHMNEILGSMGISEVLNWLLHYRPGH